MQQDAVHVVQEKGVPQPYDAGAQQKVVQEVDYGAHGDGDQVQEQVGIPDLCMDAEERDGHQHGRQDPVDGLEHVLRQGVDKEVFFQAHGEQEL